MNEATKKKLAAEITMWTWPMYPNGLSRTDAEEAILAILSNYVTDGGETRAAKIRAFHDANAAIDCGSHGRCTYANPLGCAAHRDGILADMKRNGASTAAPPTDETPLREVAADERAAIVAHGEAIHANPTSASLARGPFDCCFRAGVAYARRATPEPTPAESCKHAACVGRTFCSFTPAESSAPIAERLQLLDQAEIERMRSLAIAEPSTEPPKCAAGCGRRPCGHGAYPQMCDEHSAALASRAVDTPETCRVPVDPYGGVAGKGFARNVLCGNLLPCADHPTVAGPCTEHGQFCDGPLDHPLIVETRKCANVGTGSGCGFKADAPIHGPRACYCCGVNYHDLQHHAFVPPAEPVREQPGKENVE